MNQLDQPSDLTVVDDDLRPSPADFITFLPWACRQLQIENEVMINKTVISDYTANRTKTKSKLKQSLAEVHSDHVINLINDGKSLRLKSKSRTTIDNTIKILAAYHNEFLSQIKFDGNKTLPRVILRIISLIIKFHQHLQSITINKGLDMYTIYELTKIIPVSLITEICLDGNFVREGNYHILLDNPGQLKQLSLARCSIDDNIVETLAAKLTYPLPASSILSILNLSSNRITDVGAKHLATALRSNRQLSYLNLANNMITDDGARAILSSLTQFFLTIDELREMRKRHLVYLKNKVAKVMHLAEELRDSDVNLEKKRSQAKKRLPKVVEQAIPFKKDRLNRSSSKSLPETLHLEIDRNYYVKAEIMIENLIGDFVDPYGDNNTFKRNGLLYSQGNNTLCYLNLAYNNLTYCILKKLLTVLEHQRFLTRRPKGLTHVCLDGNPMPNSCYELTRIETILDNNAAALDRRRSLFKKRPTKLSVA